MKFGIIFPIEIKNLKVKKDKYMYMTALSAMPNFLTNSLIYKEFIEERNEILKHKWLESEKIGYDIGFDKAIFDWIINHRTAWRKKRMLTIHEND